jgi:branched-chain amino acid transport system substrate-binding protein
VIAIFQRLSQLFLIGMICIAMPVAAADIVVGQVAPFTGPLAPTGKHMQLGGQVYFDAINAKGGIHGAKIRLIVSDDGYKVDQTVKEVKAMLEMQKPIALFGLVGTGNMEALLTQGVLAEANVPVVAVRTGATSVRTPFNPYIFHVRASYRDEVEKIIDQLAQFGIKNVAALYQNDPFGQDGLTGIEAAISKRGMKLVTKGAYEKNTTKVGDAVKTIAQAKPQAVVMIANSAAASEFIKQYRTIDKEAQLRGISVLDAVSLVAAVGPESASGVGIAQVMPTPYKSLTALSKEFQDNFKRFAPKDVEPTYTTLEGYAGAKVLVEGLKRAGPNPTREKLMKALESIESYDLGGFLIDFGKDNRAGSNYVDLAVISKDGKVKQ